VIDEDSPRHWKSLASDGGHPRRCANCPSLSFDRGRSEVACQDSPTPLSSPTHFPVQPSPALARPLRSLAAFVALAAPERLRFDGIVMNGIWVSPTSRSVRPPAIPASRMRLPARRSRSWFNKKYPLKHSRSCSTGVQYPVLRDARAVLFTTATERDLASTSFRPIAGTACRLLRHQRTRRDPLSRLNLPQLRPAAP